VACLRQSRASLGSLGSLGLLVSLLTAACGAHTVRVRPAARVTPTRAALVGGITSRVSAYATTLSWRTSLASRGYVEYGTTSSYGLWSSLDPVAATRHASLLDGLVFGQTYQYRVVSLNAAGATMSADRVFRTPPRRDPRTSISRTDQVLLDGHPYFPIMQWLQCPSLFETNVALGINTFLGQGCSNTVSDEVHQTAQVGAMSVLPYSSAVRNAPSLFGWRAPDEPDGSGIRPSGISVEFRKNRARDPHHINLLNLSSNFFSRLPPPSWMHGDRRIYKKYTQAADFPGFDIYPIYGWCQPSLIWWEAAAAREFGDIYARGKPFYSWIEAASTSSQWCTGRGVYANEVRAEVWMAITNGAKGIGYFTHSWSPTYSQFRVSAAVQAEMRRTDRQITNFTGTRWTGGLHRPSVQRRHVHIRGERRT
jgi:hypothetical protein